MIKQILLSTPHMGSLEQEFVKEAFDTNWIAPVGPHVDALLCLQEVNSSIPQGKDTAVSCFQILHHYQFLNFL
jgi:hypothetical protein